MYGVGAGIYKPAADQGTTPGGHAIECLGWGHDEDGAGFWIMKNSWGTTWGDAGYMRLVRTGDGPGQCGIQNDATWAKTGNA